MYYTTKRIAEVYGVNEETVRRWIRKGELAAIRLSDRSIRVREDQLQDFEKKRITALESAS